jgi:hypothetical protein
LFRTSSFGFRASKMLVGVNDITQIPARDDAGHRQTFHHFLPDRRSQACGVTAFAPMADTADHWDDLGILAVNLDLPLCLFLLDASETGRRNRCPEFRQRTSLKNWNAPLWTCRPSVVDNIATKRNHSGTGRAPRDPPGFRTSSSARRAAFDPHPDERRV